ncbi:MAG: TPM domain-containing protein [Bacteroidetes bacterium]|nr:TPM domain-containing protein [Bacteroidota bacterium]
MKRFFIALCFFLAFVSHAQIPERSNPPRLYNNFSKEFPNFLTDEQVIILENKLEAFSNETSNQICVVIVDDLNGMDASSFAIQLGNEWGVGKQKFDNGIVILIKPTGSAGGRDLFIAVGYGLEGAIPDLATKRIREEQMYPYLKNGDYFTALDKGTDVLMQLAKGEIDVKDYTRYGEAGDLKTAVLIVILVVILLIIIFRKKGGGGQTYSHGGRHIYWGSGLGGFSGGRGFGGGSSSGGWGGFGGGSFGGGGSGGKW